MIAISAETDYAVALKKVTTVVFLGNDDWCIISKSPSDLDSIVRGYSCNVVKG